MTRAFAMTGSYSCMINSCYFIDSADDSQKKVLISDAELVGRY